MLGTFRFRMYHGAQNVPVSPIQFGIVYCIVHLDIRVERGIFAGENFCKFCGFGAICESLNHETTGKDQPARYF